MRPNLRYRRWSLAIAALVLAGGISPHAKAALGEDVASVTSLKAKLGASLRVRARERFAIHELALPTGTKVREFVGEAGKVFAVAWSGGWRPNLRDIMGSHYERFIAATRGRRAIRGIVRIELPGMVVVMGGHLRNFFGHVVLTELVPAGLSPDELR
jgi:hypothetical protein